MDKIYTRKAAQVNKTHTAKSSLGIQNTHYKKQLWWTIYILKKVAQVDIYLIP